MRVAWNGAAAVGGGVSTFHFGDSDMLGNPAAVLAFFDAIKGFFPNDVVWSVPSSGDVIDTDKGELIGAWSASGGGDVVGQATSAWVAGVGCRVRWAGTGIVAGHRPVGTTFLTSMASQEFTDSGIPQTLTLNTIANAANALIANSTNLTIWVRPVPVKPPTTPPTYVRLGGSTPVSSATVPPATSWLRTRRT